MMEKAIQVMRESISEPRDDGKACPKVGAVLIKADGTIEMACRGELRYGDHAEYTLLERKNRSERLDGAVLFTTLEPCAPGSREPPKMSCAERIVLARIRQVWVGVEDPDPTVDSKGIKYLQEQGIDVVLFDRDIQDIIRQDNADFMAQALERAATTETEEPERVVLSPLEAPVATAAVEDFSAEALEAYRSAIGMNDSVDSEILRRRLVQQGLLRVEGEKVEPTGFGLLLFGAHPRAALPQAGLLATIRYPNGEDETRDFDGPLVLVPGQFEKWLQNKLPSTIDRNQMQRQDIPSLPFELVREAIVNALVHRDYDIVGAKCQIIVTEDTITMKSPGLPPAPITLEQLQSFQAPMLSRNPQLHYVFSRMKLAEERGLGMQSFRTRPEELGLPRPSYSFDDPYLSLIVYRTAQSATRVLPRDVRDSLNKDESSGWEYVASKDAISRKEYAAHMKFDDRKAQRHLTHFVELGLVYRVGAGRATVYKVRRP